MKKEVVKFEINFIEAPEVMTELDLDTVKGGYVDRTCGVYIHDEDCTNLTSCDVDWEY